jgi:molybdopterin molybdotransferase
MITTQEADRRLAKVLPPSRMEAVGLVHAAGRCLAQPLVADRDGPPYHRVAMDGYAVSSAEGLDTWTVNGLQVAGRPPQERSGKATAIEVTTGAVLPGGCDTVIRYEDTDRSGETVSLKPGVKRPSVWMNVHRQGADYHRGELLIPAGTRLRSPHLHSLASEGTDTAVVIRRPVWALAATGDELVEVRDQPLAWQIRRSNAAAIVGEAGTWGLKPLSESVLPDNQIRLEAGLQALLPGLDVLVLTGGVSAGLTDLVPRVLTRLGAETLFHQLAQRPGRPFWCGQLGSTMIFGLPGNPVSSLFTFRRYVLPWLLACEGRKLAETRVPVSGLKDHQTDQTVFLPWSHSLGVMPWRGSGDFRALAESDGFLELDNDPRSLTEPKVHLWGDR